MYTGTLIDDLISMVERTEKRTRQEADASSLEQWYASAARECAQNEANLLGVA